MKTYSSEWLELEPPCSIARRDPLEPVNIALRQAAKAFLALVPALAIVVGSVWMATNPGLVIFLQATLWASGFIFLGLAIDIEKPSNGLCLATGIVVPVLADLSSWVAVEFAILASVIIALWLAAAIWRK